MAMKPLPANSSDLITQLEHRFPDKLDVDENASPFDRGKRAGVIELIRELKIRLKGESVMITPKI